MQLKRLQRLNEGTGVPDADQAHQADQCDADDPNGEIVSPAEREERAERGAFIQGAMEDIIWEVLPLFLTDWVQKTYAVLVQQPDLLPDADAALLYQLCSGLLGEASVAGLEAELVAHLRSVASASAD